MDWKLNFDESGNNNKILKYCQNKKGKSRLRSRRLKGLKNKVKNYLKMSLIRRCECVTAV